MSKYIFIVIGIIAFSFGIFSIKRSLDLKNNGLTATGTIIDYKQERNSDNEIMYRAVIEYTDSNGELRTHSSSTSKSWKGKVGIPQELIYTYKDPNQSQVKVSSNSIMGIWGISIILIPLGLLFTLFGIFGKPVQRRRGLVGTAIGMTEAAKEFKNTYEDMKAKQDPPQEEKPNIFKQ